MESIEKLWENQSRVQENDTKPIKPEAKKTNSLVDSVFLAKVAACISEVMRADRTVASLLTSEEYHNTIMLLHAYRLILRDERKTMKTIYQNCKRQGIPVAELESIDDQHNHSKITEIGLALGKCRKEREILKFIKSSLRRIRSTCVNGERSYRILSDEFFTYEPIREHERIKRASGNTDNGATICRSTYYEWRKTAVRDFRLCLFGMPSAEAELFVGIAMNIQSMHAEQFDIIYTEDEEEFA